jgi:hypothetical protein
VQSSASGEVSAISPADCSLSRLSSGRQVGWHLVLAGSEVVGC